jgi:hypothetical protein
MAKFSKTAGCDRDNFIKLIQIQNINVFQPGWSWKFINKQQVFSLEGCKNG